MPTREVVRLNPKVSRRMRKSSAAAIVTKYELSHRSRNDDFTC